MNQRRSRYLTAVVGEDWYPTVTGSVYAVLSSIEGEGWRVAVWGGDDFGLERNGLTEQEAVDLFERLPEPLPQEWLRQRGFVDA